MRASGVALCGHRSRSDRLPDCRKWMVLCLTLLFPDQPIESVEIFDRIEEQHRRKMLGQLVSRATKACPACR